MALKILALEGLNNAKMCSMIEPVLCTVKGVNSVQIDYLSQRLTMDVSGRPTEDIVKDVMELLRQSFPNVRVRLSDAAIFQQPRLNTTPRRAEADPDDYYIDDTMDEYEDELPQAEAEELKTPWVQRLQERLMEIKTEEILRIIFWACIILSLLFLLLSGSWRDGGVMHPYLSAMSYFFALFSSLFVGENPRSDNWLIRAAAVASTLTTFISGRHAEAVLAFLVYALGVMFVDTFYNRYEEKTKRELILCPETVTCIRGEQTLNITPEEVREGDLVEFGQDAVLPFRGILERKPAIILSFGETQPHEAEVGDMLQKGDRSLEGPIIISIADANPGLLIPSVRSLILDSSLENTDLTSRAKIWLTALIGVGAGAALIYYLVNYGLRLDWQGLYIIALLVAALFPCGLSVSCQVAQRGCLRFLGNKGTLLGSVHLLERIPKMKKVVMNHIGFVTEGHMQVEEFVPVEGHVPEDVIEAAASIEALMPGDNPIAKAILQYAMEHLELENLPTGEFVEGFEVLDGYGIRGMRQDVLVMVGSERMMNEIGMEVPLLEDGRMAMYVAIRGEYVGAFVLNDAIREDSIQLIRDLHQSGVEEVGLITGYDGMAVRAATLLTGADSSYVEPTHRERRALLERLRGAEKGKKGDEVAIIGPTAKIREFFDLCICMETGSMFQPPEEVTLPREQEVHLAGAGPKEISVLLRASHALSRSFSMSALVLVVPKAFLIASVMLWHIPLPVIYGINTAIALLLYLLAATLFSEERRKQEAKPRPAAENTVEEPDYMM